MKVLNIEVITREHSDPAKTSLVSVVQHYLQSILVKTNTTITEFDETHDSILHSAVKAIIIEDDPEANDEIINWASYDVKWHVYLLDIHGPTVQTEDDENNEEIATYLTLPSQVLYNLWENLYYEDDIKENLLQYAQTIMEFSDKGVDPNIVSSNRVILLHGPPGTGKTSLCKALAQKLSIRMNDRYNSGILIEINSHSLFSKWFSESGKLVTKMFTKIREIVENPNILVCVLIDEVESLAHARTQCLGGNEPSDSIRVVNAVLTQIDQIKTYSNVLILTTSNMTQSIDLAFIDRADIKQFLGLPTTAAIYKVYYSCIQELIRVKIITGAFLLNSAKSVLAQNRNECGDHSRKLIELCEESNGLSGRALRKVPFLAHALFLRKSGVTLDQFLEAMQSAVRMEKIERKHFEDTTV